jgi:hypothetical protein
MANSPVISKQAEPASINKLVIFSNKDNGKTSSDIANGISQFQYYESIMQDCIRATVIFGDTGNAVNGKTVFEGLPLVGTERVELELVDNNDQKLKLTLYVNKATPLSDSSTKGLFSLDLVSKEFILNEKSRLNKRFDGRISDHVRSALTSGGRNGLETKKKINIEETSLVIIRNHTIQLIGYLKWPCRHRIRRAERVPDIFSLRLLRDLILNLLMDY